MNKIYDNLILFVDNTIDNNTYILIKDYHCVIIDLSWNTDDVERYIKQNNLILDGLILTHGHYDHIGDSFKLAEKHKVKVYAHFLEKDVVISENLSNFLNSIPYINDEILFLFKEPTLIICGFEFNVLLTPGHSTGSVCLKYDNYVFSGDLVFFDSIGRCDLPHSNPRKMYFSIASFMRLYNDDNFILPGHGKIDFLKEIKNNNKYLKADK